VAGSPSIPSYSSPDEARRWADDGLWHEYEGEVESIMDLLLDYSFPLAQEEAMTFVRAAYGRGYSDGLSDGKAEEVPLIARHTRTLELLLPVA
jgi:hypothetical protein